MDDRFEIGSGTSRGRGLHVVGDGRPLHRGISWAERARRCAHRGPACARIEPGDRVGVGSPNNAEWAYGGGGSSAAVLRGGPSFEGCQLMQAPSAASNAVARINRFIARSRFVRTISSTRGGRAPVSNARRARRRLGAKLARSARSGTPPQTLIRRSCAMYLKCQAQRPGESRRKIENSRRFGVPCSQRQSP